MRRLKLHIEAALPGLAAPPAACALQALQNLSAATVVAELGDITFGPNLASSWLNDPSEHLSSGYSGIDEAGNGAAWRMLIEAAWS